MKFDFNLDFLSLKSSPLIGVDISASAIKMVELTDTGKSVYRLENYVIETLPPDAVTDGNIANLEAVTETIQRAWKRMGTKIKSAALALPSSAIITKKITVPAGLSEHDLEMQVETEANQYIPFALDEVNLDFQEIGPSLTQPGEVEVLIAASRKEKVDDRVAVTESAGLKALVMDVESFAAQTAYELIASQLPNADKELTVAIVDIGSTTMHINVMRGEQSLYVREQTFGGNQLSQDIQRRFNLSPEEAELAKRQGGLPESYEPEVLQPFMETLSLEVARALQFFFSSTQFNQVDQILLAGGCAALPGLTAIVAKRTQVNTLIANPFANMVLSPRVKPRQLTSDAPALLIACGLAMRSFDE
ncbi:MAG: pilus assembly protein PilM [Burkholderiales bacterium]